MGTWKTVLRVIQLVEAKLVKREAEASRVICIIILL